VIPASNRSASCGALCALDLAPFSQWSPVRRFPSSKPETPPFLGEIPSVQARDGTFIAHHQVIFPLNDRLRQWTAR